MILETMRARVTRSVLFLCLFPFVAMAQERAAQEETKKGDPAGSGVRQDDALRDLDADTRADDAPVEEILRTVLGTATRPVAFDWRRRDALVSFEYGQLVEYNNFESSRFSLGARWPGESGTFDTSLAYVGTKGTEATRTIARTPYLQTGRPSRWELGLGYSFAFAEGIVTQAPSFLPQAQMVFSFTGELRYLFYPGAWAQEKGARRLTALLRKEATGTGKAYLDAHRPEGMKVDPSLIDLLVGTRLDVYVRPGVLLSPAVQLALPLLRAKDGLRIWWVASLGVGYAI